MLPLIGAALFPFLLSISVVADISTISAKIYDISVRNPAPFSDKTALRIIRLQKGMVFTPELAQDGAERLRRIFQLEGYPLARIGWRAMPNPENSDQINLHYSCEKGPYGFLRKVTFVGNRALSNQLIQSALLLRPSRSKWMARVWAIPITTETVEHDRLAILKAYRKQGYAAVVLADPQIVLQTEAKGFEIVWRVLKEGPIYHYGTVTCVSDGTLPNKVFQQIVFIRKGERYNGDHVEAIRLNLLDFLRKQGHAFASVELQIYLREEDQEADISFVVHVGARNRLRRVILEGAHTTSRRIIEREILMQPGEIYDPVMIQLVQNRLKALPMFSFVEVLSEGSPESEWYDLKIRVEEAITGRMELGYTYNPAEGHVALFNVQEQNLALYPPFRGEALQGRLELKVGQHIQRGAIGLLEPRLLDSSWNLETELSYEDNQYGSILYDQRILGFHITSGRALRMAHSVQLGYSALRYTLYDFEPDVEMGPTMPQKFFLTSAILGWHWETKNRSPWLFRGMRWQTTLTASSRFLGGDTDAIQVRNEASVYFSPFKGHVIFLRGAYFGVDRYGQTEEVPDPLRAYLGGVNDLRGFAYRSVGPRDENGQLIGGKGAWFGTLEYQIPFFSRLAIAMYGDMGGVSSEPFGIMEQVPVSDLGVGVMIRADNLPVRIDVAFPLSTYENDSENRCGRSRISFSAGYRF